LDNAWLPDSDAELGTGHWAAVTARPQKTTLSVATASGTEGGPRLPIISPD